MGTLPQARIVEKRWAKDLPVPDRVQVALGEIAASAKEGLLAVSVGIGLQVLDLMFAEELTSVVGPKGRHDARRTAVRHGSGKGQVVLGGRKVRITRPRARKADRGEVELATYRCFQDPELLSELAYSRMVAGVSTRRYPAALEPVGEVDATGTSRSAVSRRFVVRTGAALEELLHRDLSGIRIVAIFADGIEVAEHTCVVALGVDDQGRKHVLGLREGTTENAGVCRALLADLIERGLAFDEGILVVIDGGKGLRKAVRSVFGSLALIARCTVHKKRNVLDHLPRHLHAFVGGALDRAWAMKDTAAAERALRALAGRLEDAHPDAAASILEGLAETLTVMRLGIGPSLRRTLQTTNPIESANSVARTVTRGVKRWRDGKMVKRWIAAGMLEAERQFRRVKGYREIPALIAALKVHAQAVSDQGVMIPRSA